MVWQAAGSVIAPSEMCHGAAECGAHEMCCSRAGGWQAGRRTATGSFEPHPPQHPPQLCACLAYLPCFASLQATRGSARGTQLITHLITHN